MFLDILYYPSVVVCFATCVIVSVSWVKFLLKSKNDSSLSESEVKKDSLEEEPL